MPKIEIVVKKINRDETWIEEYVIDDTDPKEWATEIIDQFNETLRPDESARELVSVKVLDNEDHAKEHDWNKTNSYTITKGSKSYDTMACTKCGITGKRKGLNDFVERDLKYKAIKYNDCIK